MMSAILTPEDPLLVRDIALNGLCKAGDEVAGALQLDTNPTLDRSLQESPV